MRNLLSGTLIIIMLMLFTCGQAPANEAAVRDGQENFDPAIEEAAIMALIDLETKCFFDRDYDCWKDCWVKEDYAVQVWNNRDGSFSAARGWEEIDEQGLDYIESSDASDYPKLKREGIQTQFYNAKLAYLSWRQFNANQSNSHYQPSLEVRLMEKVDGNWKIAHVSAFWDYSVQIPASNFE